jgi:hypothetical protein
MNTRDYQILHKLKYWNNTFIAVLNMKYMTSDGTVLPMYSVRTIEL